MSKMSRAGFVKAKAARLSSLLYLRENQIRELEPFHKLCSGAERGFLAFSKAWAKEHGRSAL